jgi:pSer/pThr/pTyr-binding forkhead associated (FHA) protein
MRVKLKVLKGAGAGKEIPVPVKKFFIGRGDDCHLRPKSEAISRHHCAIVSTDKQVAVRDFGSKNGTFVNDKRIENACILNPGDKLSIGPLHFEVMIEQSPGRGKLPKVRDMADVAQRSAQSMPDEADISAWLDDAIAEDSNDDTITRQFTFTTKSEEDLAAETLAALDDETDPGDEAGKDGSSIFRWGKKKPGKLPERPEEKEADDSRDAAADTLRKYFNRG